jgi:Flp pilus assembly protein TadG
MLKTHLRPRERGFVLVLYTLMMLFIIIPMVGLAIDAGILYTIKAKLQAAVDGASLGAARSLNRGQDITSQMAAADDTATRYYHANFPDNWMAVTPVSDPTVTWPVSPNPATAIINVVGVVNAPTWFMRILGFNSVHLTALGQATRRDVNVLLVIDRSGSLATSGSCPTLASSAALFVDSFSNNRDRMGLVSFGTYYNVDFPFNYNFQSGLSTLLGSLNCVGWTNAGAAYWKGYQTLKALGDLNALNVILFFTDGQPNTITFGTGDGGSGPLLPEQSSGGCNATPGFSGTVGGNADGIYQQTIATYPAANPDQFLIGSSGGNNGGCNFGKGINRSISSDVPYLPASDVWGNSISTSLLGGAGFPASVTKSGGNIQVSSSNVTNGGINSLDNAAQRARQDASNIDMPFVVYTIGLGNSGGVNDELLKRIANDPSALAYQSAYSTGTYIYTPDTAHLASAFAAIADDIMRISK